MSKELKDISLIQKNAVFGTIVALYDYVDEMITEVENTSDSDKRNTYITILNDLIAIIDTSSRTISTEYSNIIQDNKVSKISSNKIKKALNKIFQSVSKAKKLLH